MFDRVFPTPRRSTATMGLLVLTILAAVAARADEITVKGAVLKGQVEGLTGEGVEFKTEYGEGTLLVPYGDIANVVTDGEHHVLFGEDQHVFGRLLGIEDGALLVGKDAETAVRIDVADIFRGQTVEEYEGSPLARMRDKLRYWTANFDFGYGVTQSTTDTSTLTFGFRSERKKSPTRLVLQTGYLFDTEKKKDAERSTLDNELRGLVKGEYDLTERVLLLASVDGEYDEVDRLSIRTVPLAGVGYRLYKSDTANFQVEMAPAYVYERYFGGNTNDYAAIAFGAESYVDLPFDAKWHGRADYLPSVSEWTDDYLIRAETSLTMPIIGFLAFKASLFEQYDNTPDEDTDPNELKLLFGLSLVF